MALTLPSPCGGRLSLSRKRERDGELASQGEAVPAGDRPVALTVGRERPGITHPANPIHSHKKTTAGAVVFEWVRCK